MALIYDKGVLIAADSRTSSGQYVADRVADKLEFIHDRIFCLRSGSAADTQTVSRIVRNYLAMHAVELGRLPHVKTAARLFQQILYQNKDNLEASIVVGGWDPYEGSQIYALPLGGSSIQRNFAIAGSGSLFIYGFCDANFREGFSLEEAKKFAVTSKEREKKMVKIKGYFYEDVFYLK
jgi:20S proteasome subunit beta 1